LKSFEQGFTYSFASPPLMSEWAYMSFIHPVEDLLPKADWPKSIALLTSNNVMDYRHDPTSSNRWRSGGSKSSSTRPSMFL